MVCVVFYVISHPTIILIDSCDTVLKPVLKQFILK